MSLHTFYSPWCASGMQPGTWPVRYMAWRGLLRVAFHFHETRSRVWCRRRPSSQGRQPGTELRPATEAFKAHVRNHDTPFVGTCYTCNSTVASSSQFGLISYLTWKWSESARLGRYRLSSSGLLDPAQIPSWNAGWSADDQKRCQ
jgi:hypothetical protein